MYLHGTSRVNEHGHLEIGGCDTVDLAKQYGTPLYVMDESLIREKMRSFMQATRETELSFQMAYASKAFSTMAMCQIVEEEGFYLDVVSEGELYTALQAGFPAELIYSHGNNKSLSELHMGLEAGIGRFVVDNWLEMERLQYLAQERDQQVQIWLRITPGVEAHTHEYIQTGQEDSKFGFDLTNGQAEQAAIKAYSASHLILEGFHCHIGSQMFEMEGIKIAIERMAQFIQTCEERHGIKTKVLNLGGGFGVRYTIEDQPRPIQEMIESIADAIRHSFPIEHKRPQIWLGPGRSIVAEAGTTLYTVGATKEIPSVRKYIMVDGGMTDNPRPALYGANYEAMLANRAEENIYTGTEIDSMNGHVNCQNKQKETVTIAGKCCESGDLLIRDIDLPQVKSGDILAISCTGAYHYTMASNYNRQLRPAVVFVRDGESELIVAREALEDLLRLECTPRKAKAKPWQKVVGLR